MGNVLGDQSNITAKVTGNSPQPEKDKLKKLGFLEAEKIFKDQSRKIESPDGNMMGNVLGDQSNITAKVTGNSPQPEKDKLKKLGFLEAEKILNDQSRKIEHVMGNILGDQSHIPAKVTRNSPQSEKDKLKKLGFLEAEKFLNDQSRKIESQDGNVTGNVLGDRSNIAAKVTGNSPQSEKDKLKKLGFLEAEKFLNDQSQKIENKNGNVTGNVLGDRSNIAAKVTGNSPQSEKDKLKKLGFLEAEKFLNDQSRKIESQDGNITGNVLGDRSHIAAKVTGNSPQSEKDKLKKLGFLEAEKFLNDQTRTIENVMGNILGDQSNITAKVTGNSPQSEKDKLKKLGFLEAEKILNDQSQKIENKNGNVTGNVLGDQSHIAAKVTGNSPPPEKDKFKKPEFLEAEKILNDQSRKMEIQDGNVMGNVLGNESNITVKVTGNSPPPEKQEPKKFGFLDFLTWMQNGQILYYLGSAILGVILLIIYPKLFPSGFPKLVEKIQDIFPAPQVEKEFDKKQ